MSRFPVSSAGGISTVVDWKFAPIAQPRPLKTEDDVAFLEFALRAIEKRWGSIDGYLRKEVGLTDADFATLRRTYLE